MSGIRPLQGRILDIMRERASTYPDSSRLVYAEEVALTLAAAGELRYPDLAIPRVAANLRSLARRGLVTRDPGPGTGGWMLGDGRG